MLSHLVIRNFAIIKHLEIPFKRGFTVLTGETGAGKSIVIDALNLLLGGRASAEIIRTDEDAAVVEGIFEPSPRTLQRLNIALEERGMETFEDQVVVRRIVSRNGRNKVFINGSLTTVKALGELTQGLVDISGQHEHYSLLDPEGHVGILDDFAGMDTQLEKMRAAWSSVSGLRAQLRKIHANTRDRAMRIDFLRYQLEEIDALELTPGEDVALEEELSLLRHAEKIERAGMHVLHLCYEQEHSANNQISEAMALLNSVAPYDKTLASLGERLQEVGILLDDVVRDLSRHLSGLDSDASRLDDVIERVEAIKHLQRKHGSSVDEIIERAEQMRQELHQLEHAEEHSQGLADALKTAELAALKVAHQLSLKRRQVARDMEARVEQELADLNMARTRFVVHFGLDILPKRFDQMTTHTRDALLEQLGPDGFDAVEFLIAPNVGELPKPMAKIASGGELSRVMLVLKSALVERDPVDTYVFDEVDTGIGGSTADMVGIKIHGTSKHHQVLCITHLAQIASRCDHHYLVEKQLVDDRTQSTIRPLSESERVEEIARMLGGTRVTDKTLDAARELVNVIPLSA